CLVAVAIVIIFLLRGAPRPQPPPLGFERVPQEESAARAAVARALANTPPERAGSGRCVAATFTVVDNLDPALAIGVLQPGRQYPAHVSVPTTFAPATDPARVGPAMAIRLFGVDGEFVREADAGARTHDFILGTQPGFPYADAAAYAAAIADYLEQPAGAGSRSSPPTRWWSMSPYRFGKRHAVKYGARSCAPIAGAACFEFMLQFQTDPARMPVEDASVAWDEALSPFEPVALIVLGNESLPRVDCDVAFSPWQALTVHAPLGGINRLRRVLDGKLARPRPGSPARSP
ncbi:MAG: hypothetical protein ACU85U_06430, partial [Gammaproteobacteria bacterium]